MTRKRNKNRKTTFTGKGKTRAKKQPSLFVPIVVGVVVVVLALAIVFSLRDRQSAGGASGALSTAQPLSSQSIPYPTVPRASLDETQEKLDLGQAVLVDVRSSASYEKSHAAGAISIPEEEIDARLEDLPRDKDLVLY